jgi:hypothetical protein
MATIRTELYRDGEQHPWITVQVLNRNEMSLTFTNSKGENITVGRLTKKDADQLGDVIRNASIDYMDEEDNEA